MPDRLTRTRVKLQKAYPALIPSQWVLKNAGGCSPLEVRPFERLKREIMSDTNENGSAGHDACYRCIGGCACNFPEAYSLEELYRLSPKTVFRIWLG